MTARAVIFNGLTAPRLERALQDAPRRSRFAEWSYWKLMLRHTQHGYDSTAPRQPMPTPTRPAPDPARAEGAR